MLSDRFDVDEETRCVDEYNEFEKIIQEEYNEVFGEESAGGSNVLCGAQTYTTTTTVCQFTTSVTSTSAQAGCVSSTGDAVNQTNRGKNSTLSGLNRTNEVRGNGDWTTEYIREERGSCESRNTNISKENIYKNNNVLTKEKKDFDIDIFNESNKVVRFSDDQGMERCVEDGIGGVCSMDTDPGGIKRNKRVSTNINLGASKTIRKNPSEWTRVKGSSKGKGQRTRITNGDNNITELSRGNGNRFGLLMDLDQDNTRLRDIRLKDMERGYGGQDEQTDGTIETESVPTGVSRVNTEENRYVNGVERDKPLQGENGGTGFYLL